MMQVIAKGGAANASVSYHDSKRFGFGGDHLLNGMGRLGLWFQIARLQSDRNGSVWAIPTEKEARAAAMRLCKQTQKGCFVTTCRAGIDSKEQAYAV
jgi:hypothetical protein